MAQQSTVQRFFDDLLNLEVNLILKPDMTARKMPLTHEAFDDVATRYDDYLDEQAVRAGGQRTRRSGGDVTSDVFRNLASEARERNTAALHALDSAGGTAVMLKRIERTSEQLARILTTEGSGSSRPGDGTWRPLTRVKQEDLLILRKAWEVSTEEVVMQTVAQLDGDILTRLQPAYADAGHAPLHAVHARLVTTGLEHWRFMFATVATLTLNTFQGFFRS